MNSKSFFLAAIFVSSWLPILALAADPVSYKPLIGIPGIQDSSTFGDYINALYGLSIAIAALMAVIKIIVAGVKYMLSDVVTSKQEAIGDIRGSLLGLIVVISAVLVLTVINPQLTKTTIFIDPVTLPNPGTTPVVAPPKVIEGKGYRYRDNYPADAGFKTTCTNVPSSIYTLGAGGRYEVCYDPLPNPIITELSNIFSSQSFNFTALVDRYQTAHYPRLIEDAGKLNQIAAAENSKNRVASDVYLAVKFYDGSNDNPPVYLDWIDGSNVGSIDDTCLQFKRSFELSGIQKNIKSVGDAYKGYLACVELP